MTASNYRNVYKKILPSWMTAGDGDAVLYSLMSLDDAFVERLREGLQARFPSRAGASALTLMGQDRLILRGRSELDEHYAQRLIRWRYPQGHRIRGNAYAALEQISEYFGGFDAYTIDVSGNVRSRTTAGAISSARGVAWDWDGAAASPNWGRFWVVISPTPDQMSAWPDWDSATSQDDDSTVGLQGVSPDDVIAIRNLFQGDHPWKPAGTRSEWLIINLDGTTQTPDGTWLHWSQNVLGTQTPTRYPGWRYWSLTPQRNNVYAGDPNNYPARCILFDGTLYAGDPNNYPADVTMLDGSTYAGNPDSFPGNVELIDDGSPL